MFFSFGYVIVLPFSFTFRRVRFIRKAATALNENFGIATGGVVVEGDMRGCFVRGCYFRIIVLGMGY